MNVPIIVACYDRIKSLKRLLESLEQTQHNNEQELILSLDGNDSIVKDYIEKYTWPFGAKRVIQHKKKLGLKNHILECLSVGLEYDGIVILEDDLWVSPLFPAYKSLLLQNSTALQSYSSFAFYHQHFFPSNGLPREFNLDTCYSTTFPCSWGFMIFREELDRFIRWSEIHVDVDLLVPGYMSGWTDSWKKIYAAYLVSTQKRVLYPPGAIITNFGDVGVHHKTASAFFQAPLLLKISDLDLFDEIHAFDNYFEIEVDQVKKWIPDLEAYDFSVDLNGQKPLKEIQTSYLISSKTCSKPIRSWCSELKPIERNIQFNVRGHQIHLGRKEDFIDSRLPEYLQFERHMPVPSSKTLMYWMISKVLNRLLS